MSNSPGTKPRASAAPPAPNELRRIAILLADRAVQALTPNEEAELNALLLRHPQVDASELDEAAAAYHLAQPILPESMPEKLRVRIFTAANQFFDQEAESAITYGTQAHSATRAAHPSSRVPPATNPTSRSVPPTLPQTATLAASVPPHSMSAPAAASVGSVGREAVAPLSTATTITSADMPASNAPKASGALWARGNSAPKVNAASRGGWLLALGWLLAASALALAVAGWWRAREYQRQLASVVQATGTAAPAAERTALLARMPGAQPLVWQAANYPGMQKVRGDVVWHQSEQRGFVRLVGMPVNNAQQQTYQLWITDAQQEERFPVSGGTFDIINNNEIVLPLRPQLRIDQPLQFFITIEKPGGVVVSKRDKVALIANVPLR